MSGFSRAALVMRIIKNTEYSAAVAHDTIRVALEILGKSYLPDSVIMVIVFLRRCPLVPVDCL